MGPPKRMGIKGGTLYEIHKQNLLYDQPSLKETMTVPTSLQKLIDAARGRVFTAAEREAQRRSFAYGNTRIENPLITRKTIDEQAELLMKKAPKS
jgi:hypothetical protein